MKICTYRIYNPLFACGGIGLVFGGIHVVGSWLENMFYVMGPGPSLAAREAFSADLSVGGYIVVASVVLGMIATAVSQRVHRQRPEEKTRWSDVFGVDLETSEPGESSEPASHCPNVNDFNQAGSL